LHGHAKADVGSPNNEESSENEDILLSIHDEIAEIKQPKTAPLFSPLRVDLECGQSSSLLCQTLIDVIEVVFFKTRMPLEPVSFVQQICSDAAAGILRKQTRFAKRLSPMTLIARATEPELEELAHKVLGPHFHRADNPLRKVRSMNLVQPRY
jgi:tRNA acetyltransferase TAN1